MKKLIKKDQSGFTLIELLVVIAIIGLLSTLSVLALNSARARSRDAKRVADIKQVQTALEMYFNDNNAYPSSLTFGSPLATSSVTYMAQLPNAPVPFDGSGCTAVTNNYAYSQSASGASYSLTYCLGSNTGDVTAGLHTATPAGIQ